MKRRREGLVRLPGGATSPDEITDFQLLNGLDQIRDAAIFSPSLKQKTRETIVEAADSVKRSTTQPSETSKLSADKKAVLLNTLSNRVVNKIRDSAELDEETGKEFLGILKDYVPE